MPEIRPQNQEVKATKRPKSVYLTIGRGLSAAMAAFMDRGETASAFVKVAVAGEIERRRAERAQFIAAAEGEV